MSYLTENVLSFLFAYFCLFSLGYSRIILAFVSFYYMADSPVIFTVCYLLSALLDAFDGHFARLLSQSKLICSTCLLSQRDRE
jgi:phosphatidylglycerophosphate synthase